MKLYKHQQQAVDETLASVAFGSKKVLIDAATAFGKSLVIAELAKQLPGKVAIVVTFTALIEQIAEHLNALGMDYSILKAGIEERFDESKRIQIIMKQTLYARMDKVNIKADYMIKDEVHVEWLGQKRMDLIYSYLKEPTLIGLSATNYDSKGYKLKGADDIISTTSVKELTKEGYLSPLKILVPQWSEDVDYTEIAVKGNDYSESDIDSIVLQKEYMEPAIDSMLNMGIKDKKTIVFCNSIEHSELVAGNLSAKGVKAYAFHSKMDKRLSDRVLESFRTNKAVKEKNLLEEVTIATECTVLCAVNKVNIGFSVKDITLGVMLRKMGVRSLFIQQAGRLIRTIEGKEYAELLDLANNTATWGFPDEVYNPPKHEDKEGLRKENERLAAKEIKLIVNKEPTLVERSLVLKKVVELKDKSKRIPELAFKDLIAIFETSQDTRQIIEIGYEINRRKTGQGYQNTQLDWANELWIPFIEQHSQFRSRILQTLRTRLKNIVSKSKKVASIHYFTEFLETVSPYKTYDVPDAYEPPTFDGIDIDPEDIPF